MAVNLISFSLPPIITNVAAFICLPLAIYVIVASVKFLILLKGDGFFERGEIIHISFNVALMTTIVVFSVKRILEIFAR